jgi:hypothetical protein
MSDNRPSVYVEDGTAIYRASALGHQCLTQLVAARMGYAPTAPPAWLLSRYDEGTAMEPVIIERLRREYGWVVTDDGDDSQMELEIPVGSLAKIRLHPDGRATIPDQKVNEFVLEVKAFGDDYWEKFQKLGVAGFTGYAWQTALEMSATGLPCAFVVAYKPGRMEDKTLNPDEYWETEIAFQFLEEPLVPISEIKAKVIKAEMAARKGEIPTCDGKGFFPCAFPQLHVAEKEDGDYTVDALVDAAADYLDQCRKSKKVWEEKEKTAREHLVEVLAGRSEVSTRRYTVKVGVSERATFDRKTFAASYPELDKRYTKTTTVERVDVKAAE